MTRIDDFYFNHAGDCALANWVIPSACAGSLVGPIAESLRAVCASDGGVTFNLMATAIDQYIAHSLKPKESRRPLDDALDGILMMIALELNENIVMSARTESVGR
ncbi:hypothetical protein J2X06_002608 [Lysobacter niastensis]|uniref:Uncharacterized protein n=1 Tax=Lysobacter niastensis TaxID=380629 RepID=A0ABU1WDA9_9GAMM|nr:hypothetical protein [Lysobacter niastensis]MDR7135399.1 hypothetical protein [Lysobacter niastensis]